MADLFARLNNVDFKSLARQEDRLERVRQVVKIDDRNALKTRYLIEVVVVRNEFPFKVLRERDQFQVDRLIRGFRELGVVDLQVDARHILKAVEDVEPAATANTAAPVGTVGDVLQFHDRKTRHEKRPVNEFRLHDVGDAPVDYDARIKNERLNAFNTALEFNERNNEPEIVARLQQKADPAVAENEQKRRRHALTERQTGTGRLSDALLKERLESQTHDVRRNKPDEKTEIIRGNPRNLLLRKRHVQSDDGERENQEQNKGRQSARAGTDQAAAHNGDADSARRKYEKAAQYEQRHSKLLSNHSRRFRRKARTCSDNLR